MLVRHSSYFCKSEKSCSTHCCCCWVLLSCCGLYLSLLCSFPCISNICNFYIPVDSWYHSVSYILMKCYKINIKIVFNLSLLKGMKQLIRFLTHLFALLPIDYFKVIIFINWHMESKLSLILVKLKLVVAQIQYSWWEGVSPRMDAEPQHNQIYYYFIPPHCWQNCAKKVTD